METLANAGFRTVELFGSVKALMQTSQHARRDELLTIKLANEADRFELWTVNLGVFVLGNASLDYRVRDAESIRLAISRFITSLNDALIEVLEYFDGTSAISPGRDFEDPINPSNELGGVDESFAPQDDTDADLLLEGVRDPIDRLFKLAVWICNPSSRVTSPKVSRHRVLDPETGVNLLDVFKEFDYDYQFAYWKNEHDKLSRQVATASHPNGPQPAFRNDRATNTSVSEYSAPNRQPGEDNLGFPPPPDHLSDGKSFECPYCFTVCSGALVSKRAWRAHIIHDLRPYMCTYEQCRNPDQLFDSTKDWIQHEDSMHRHVVRYPEHPADAFRRVDDDKMHLASEHPDDSGGARTVLPIELSAIAMDVRRAALDAQRARFRLSDDFLIPVVGRLGSRNRDIRWAAVDALKARSGLSGEILTSVVARLEDTNWDIRRAVLVILKAQPILSSEILTSVATRLKD
ncbi:hypothetical protein MFIFM68171_06534 [Madurella fahalii]|uniref:Oxidoreductase acuF-like C2H2 type zinc-finger domain-containing protein n=1 Tax=Madurella fahalii TaxID=1157608 RepID=A0ABQ0GF06_9PEZI